MKIAVRRVLLCIVAMSLLSIASLHFYSFLHKNYAYSLHYDSLFSAQACAEINAWVQQQAQCLPVAALAQALPQAFACIKTVQYHRTPAGQYTLSITACTPRIMLSSSHIITDSAVVPSHYFATTNFENIPQVVCAPELLVLPHAFWQPLLQLPAEFFHEYALVCQDEITTYITCKNNIGYSIVGDMRSLKSYAALHAVTKLYAAYCTKHSNNKKIQKIVYDIRFNNQILEYALRGSRYDSKQRVVS